jgi:hypothetical protein
MHGFTQCLHKTLFPVVNILIFHFLLFHLILNFVIRTGYTPSDCHAFCIQSNIRDGERRIIYIFIYFLSDATAEIRSRLPLLRFLHEALLYTNTGMISSLQRPLTTKQATKTSGEHPFPHRDSNPRPHQSKGRRYMP